MNSYTQLIVSELSCIRHQRTLFAHLNFALNSGEILHVCGANGSGKSSLLRILCNLLNPQTGRIEWQGNKDLLYLGHKIGIKLDLTVDENLKLVATLGEVYQDLNINNVLDKLDLRSERNLICQQLSAGQRQRVALARLYLLKAKIWILDEPFSALDQTSSLVLESLFKQHVSAGGMLILTSHQTLHLTELPLKRLELGHEAGWRLS